MGQLVCRYSTAAKKQLEEQRRAYFAKLDALKVGRYKFANTVAP